MAYTSDQQLAAAGLRRLADIPNRAGFKFTGRTRDGRDVDCVVGIELGLHRVVFPAGSGVTYPDLIAWRPA